MVPDDITTWMITGFTSEYSTGFGLTTQATQLKVFLAFFIQTQLPYSIVRGETIKIPLTVFNYQNFDVVATVQMNNTLNQFDFVTSDGSSKLSNFKYSI